MKQLLREALNFLENADLDSSFNPPTAKWGHDLEASLRAAIDAPEQEPFGTWHQADDPDECDFYLYKDHGDVGEFCHCCIPLYTKPQPVAELSDDEILEVFATCHEGKVYPQDFICGPKAMRLTEGRAVLEAQKGKT